MVFVGPADAERPLPLKQKEVVQVLERLDTTGSGQPWFLWRWKVKKYDGTIGGAPKHLTYFCGSSPNCTVTTGSYLMPSGKVTYNRRARAVADSKDIEQM